MNYHDILKKIKSLANPRAVEGMAKFGINPQNTYGVSMPALRKMAQEIGKNHSLAKELWSSGIHEARILASMLAQPEMVSEKEIENWVKDFDSWDVCDQCCLNLFVKTKFAYQKAIEWSKRKEEFVKRAGFVLISVVAVHDKKANDEEFLKFLPLIKRESIDERNFVRKAVNWALRQIGKRNINLNKLAIKTAKEIQEIDAKNAKWLASDALHELTSKKIQQRLYSHASLPFSMTKSRNGQRN
ncbi:MAG TPA: DNA alkylation repair protein [Elusimicrobia bacterium]|jgi:3-methyladenine DNA glycosylase AlkD|nr:DNA alkylation repair protein [Elusimicrobiota bacterium]